MDCDYNERRGFDLNGKTKFTVDSEISAEST